MYGAFIKLNEVELSRHGMPLDKAYELIGIEFENKGLFIKMPGLFFGGYCNDPVQMVLTMQDLHMKYSWFAPSVVEANMFRYTDIGDLRGSYICIVKEE